MKIIGSFAKLAGRALLAMVCFLGAQALLGLAYENKCGEKTVALLC